MFISADMLNVQTSFPRIATEMASSGAGSEGTEITMTVQLRFKPGTISRVLEQLIPIARQTREEEGNISLDIFQPKDDGDTLVVIERWQHQAALDRHLQGPNTKEVLSLYEETLLSPLSETSVTYFHDVMR